MKMSQVDYEIASFEQHRLEEEMVATSQSKFMEKVERAMKDGTIANQPWARRAVTGWLIPATKALQEYLDNYRGKKGHRPQLLKYVDVLGEETAVLIAVRVILHSSARAAKHTKSRAISLNVANWILDEYSVILMAKDLDDKDFQRIKKEADKSDRLRAKKLLNAAEKQGYIEDLDEKTKLKIGATLIEIVVKSTNLAEYQAGSVVTEGRFQQTEKYVVLTDEAKEILESAIDRALYSPEMGYWPMMLPPKRWAHDKKGGYISGPVRRTYSLIRTRGSNHRLGKELPHHSEEVYDAINKLQDTPFRVNRDVLRVLEEMVAADINPPKMRCPDDIEQLEFPKVEETDDGTSKVITDDGEFLQGTNEWAEWWARFYRERGQRKEIRDKLKGNLYEGRRAIAVASIFRDYPRIYFPWKADFRGRMYPLPQGLNPQGSKVAQGLLEFAEGKRVGARGMYWLHIHAANTYGEDKLTLYGRHQWAKLNSGMMLKVAKNPIGTLDFWGKADKPYQFLATCMEWKGLMDDGEDHISHIPVAVDGTCNGLQHLSAISLDRKTAELVNLAPGDSPQDVYGVTAKTTEDVVKTIDLDEKDNEMAMAWLRFGIDRKVAKRPVMTMPYGSTYFAVGDFILDAIHDKLGDVTAHPFPGTLSDAMKFLKPHLWQAIKETIPGARITMDWLQGSTKEASKANLPVSWTTPDGFNVVQAYHKDKRGGVDILVDGSRLRLDTYEATDEISSGKQMLGIVPNFVHSLDACHARMYIRHAADRGVSAFMMVHDDYRSHACDVDQMNDSIRETFVEMYSKDVTKPLLKSLEEQGTPYNEKLTVGDFDINEVLESTYFFG